MAHPYENLVSAQEPVQIACLKVWSDSGQRNLTIQLVGIALEKDLLVKLLNRDGAVVASQKFEQTLGSELQFQIPVLPVGLYYCVVYEGNIFKAARGVALGK